MLRKYKGGWKSVQGRGSCRQRTFRILKKIFKNDNKKINKAGRRDGKFRMKFTFEKVTPWKNG